MSGRSNARTALLFIGVGDLPDGIQRLIPPGRLVPVEEYSRIVEPTKAMLAPMNGMNRQFMVKAYRTSAVTETRLMRPLTLPNPDETAMRLLPAANSSAAGVAP